MSARLIPRLVIELERPERHALRPGRYLLGSASDSAIRLDHPTVSRRHARIDVTDAAIMIEDLGSKNGTRVDGRALEGATALGPGQALSFGSVPAHIELVSEQDLEPAVDLRGLVGRMDDASREGTSQPTIPSSVIEDFVTDLLPDALDRLMQGCERDELARSVAAALYSSLPCRSLEVALVSETADGVIFAAGAAAPPGGSGEVVEARAGEVRLRVWFDGPGMVRTYGRIVTASVGLIALAGERQKREVAAPRPVRRRIPLPEPPSVVPEVQAIYEQAARIAPSDVSVLIRGDSGTGKEVLARYLHDASERAASPWVALNCAALPRDLLEAELFGVERGVATGVEARPGKFELADGGTLFLDEIGDMSSETQARILRVIQEGEVYRIGGSRARRAAVRILSATNRDIDAMLSSGGFRRDLYHRIADWVVELPPLSRRRADIASLAAHFLTSECKRRGIRAAGISRAAIDALSAYAWPGNIRELQREMARAVLFLEDGELLETRRLAPNVVDAGRTSRASGLREMLEETERKAIERALSATAGQVEEAARALGVSRSTLYRRLRELGIQGHGSAEG